MAYALFAHPSLSIKREAMCVKQDRHNLIPYALETVARPGSRETRVRKPPDGMRIRNERGQVHGE